MTTGNIIALAAIACAFAFFAATLIYADLTWQKPPHTR